MKLLKDKCLDVLCCNAFLTDSDGSFICPRYQAPENIVLARLHQVNFLMHPGSVYKKETVLASGGYDESFRFGQDWDLWKRLSSVSRIGVNNQRLISYRISESAVSFTNFRLPKDVEYRHALLCLKNRDSKRYKYYRDRVKGNGKLLRLWMRSLFGEDLILETRLFLNRLGIGLKNYKGDIKR